MGKLRKQLIPSGLSTPFSGSVSLYSNFCTLVSVASVPAGAFHTPRVPSIREYSPAIVPLGGVARSRNPFRGSGMSILGKYRAAFFDRRVAFPFRYVIIVSTLSRFPAWGTSNRKNARRFVQSVSD